MTVVSEAPSAAPLDQRAGADGAGLPPGVGIDDPALVDIWLKLLARVADTMSVEIDRRRGRTYKIGRLEEQDMRIQTLWASQSPRYVSYVEDVAEAHVIKLRRGREVLS